MSCVITGCDGRLKTQVCGGCYHKAIADTEKHYKAEVERLTRERDEAKALAERNCGIAEQALATATAHRERAEKAEAALGELHDTRNAAAAHFAQENEGLRAALEYYAAGGLDTGIAQVALAAALEPKT